MNKHWSDLTNILNGQNKQKNHVIYITMQSECNEAQRNNVDNKINY